MFFQSTFVSQSNFFLVLVVIFSSPGKKKSFIKQTKRSTQKNCIAVIVSKWMQHNSIFTGIFNGSDTSIIGKHCGWWDVHPPTYLNKSYDSSQIRPIAELLLLEEYTWVRRKRVCRDCSDLFMESNDWLISRFSLPRHVGFDLCHNFEAQLSRETRWSNTIQYRCRCRCSLGFLAALSFQREIRDRAGVSQPTKSRVVPKVLAGIKSLSKKFIKFPYDAQLSVIKSQFYEIAWFANVNWRQAFQMRTLGTQTSVLIRSRHVWLAQSSLLEATHRELFGSV